MKARLLQKKKPFLREEGFTLLEVAVVLVIIGLIIGGVTVGQDMLRAAELNAIVSDKEKYQSAIEKFELKYNSLPGDMSNATSYWGAANGTPAICKTTASTGMPTCNGDGNGRITDSTGSAEMFRAWQHLHNADLIKGTYNGLSGNGVAGTNVPNAPFYGNYSLGHYSLATSSYPLFLSSRLTLAIQQNNGTVFPFEPDSTPSPLKVGDTVSIDTKIDDGLAETGRLIAATCNGFGQSVARVSGNYGLGGCAANPSACAYNFNSTNYCQIIFIID